MSELRSSPRLLAHAVLRESPSNVYGIGSEVRTYCSKIMVIGLTRVENSIRFPTTGLAMAACQRSSAYYLGRNKQTCGISAFSTCIAFIQVLQRSYTPSRLSLHRHKAGDAPWRFYPTTCCVLALLLNSTYPRSNLTLVLTVSLQNTLMWWILFIRCVSSPSWLGQPFD